MSQESLNIEDEDNEWKKVIETHAECELCNEEYTNEIHINNKNRTPRLLFCGHTYCQECIIQWTLQSSQIDHENKKITIHCPTCRKPTIINNENHSETGVSNLTKNIELLRFNEEVKNNLKQHIVTFQTEYFHEKKTKKEILDKNTSLMKEAELYKNKAILLEEQMEININETKKFMETVEEAKLNEAKANEKIGELIDKTDYLEKKKEKHTEKLKNFHKNMQNMERKLSLFTGSFDPRNLIIIVSTPLIGGNWVLPYIKYTILCIASVPHIDNTIIQKETRNHILLNNSIDNDDSSLKVYRRYSDFIWLYKQLCQEFKGFIIPSLPKKKKKKAFLSLFKSNNNNDFMEERRKSLQTFLRLVVKNPKIAKSNILKLFLLSSTEELNLIIKESIKNRSAIPKDENHDGSDDNSLEDNHDSHKNGSTRKLVKKNDWNLLSLLSDNTSWLYTSNKDKICGDNAISSEIMRIKDPSVVTINHFFKYCILNKDNKNLNDPTWNSLSEKTLEHYQNLLEHYDTLLHNLAFICNKEKRQIDELLSMCKHFIDISRNDKIVSDKTKRIQVNGERKTSLCCFIDINKDLKQVTLEYRKYDYLREIGIHSIVQAQIMTFSGMNDTLNRLKEDYILLDILENQEKIKKNDINNCNITKNNSLICNNKLNSDINNFKSDISTIDPNRSLDILNLLFLHVTEQCFISRKKADIWSIFIKSLTNR